MIASIPNIIGWLVVSVSRVSKLLNEYNGVCSSSLLLMSFLYRIFHFFTWADCWKDLVLALFHTR